MLLWGFAPNLHAQLDDLMIVEYVDWDPGNGLAIKIYNPTSSTINLSGYTVSVYNNGNSSPTNNVALSGTLAPSGVLVVGNSGYPCPVNVTIGGGVNGDDCVALRKGTQFVDMINLYGTHVAPRVGSVSNGLFHKRIVRENSNCLRYSFTDGTSVNSWPSTSAISVQGWVVSAPACLGLSTTAYNPAPAVIQESRSICQGDSTLVGGAYHKVAGTYYDTISSIRFCDSVLQVDLFVAPMPQGVQNLQICSGDSIFLQNAFRSSSGVYRDTLASGNCDSVVVTTLQVLSSYNSSNSMTICSGDSVLVNGRYRKAAGTFMDTLVAQNGCDSILSTQLYVMPAFNVARSLKICEGDSVFLENDWQQAAGVYRDTLLAGGGCDSLVVTTLSIYPIPETLRGMTICSNDSIFLEGRFRKISGNYRDTLTGPVGCDSILVTRLTVASLLQGSRTLELCQGDSLYLQGSWQKTPGVYHDTVRSLGGCDSVIATELKFLSHPTETYVLQYCSGDSAVINGNAWYSDTTIQISKHGGVGACDSMVTFQLNFTEVMADFDIGYLEQDLFTVYFDNYSQGPQLSYTWDFGDGESAVNSTPSHTYRQAGSYLVTLAVESPGGCMDTLVKPVTIEIPEPIEEYMKVPNVFTPNGDGSNDFFKVDGNGWPVFSIHIYNRWGTLIYESSDINFQWDGKHNGQECADGTYMFIVQGNEDIKGFVTLLR